MRQSHILVLCHTEPRVFVALTCAEYWASHPIIYEPILVLEGVAVLVVTRVVEANRLMISITAEHNTIVFVMPKIMKAVCSSKGLF